ncbi:MAG: hypothetical protein H6R01_1892, partial [Burkholderiaceae bacterium]|nr:hypothetical protein [Burkholderiaceae bacterium]
MKFHTATITKFVAMLAFCAVSVAGAQA